MDTLCTLDASVHISPFFVIETKDLIDSRSLGVDNELLQLVPVLAQVVGDQGVVRRDFRAIGQLQAYPGMKLGRVVDDVVQLKTVELLDLLQVLGLPKTMVASATTVAVFGVHELCTHVKIFATGPFRAPAWLALVVKLAQQSGFLLKAQDEEFHVSGWPVAHTEGFQNGDVGFLSKQFVIEVAGGRILGASLVQPGATNVEPLADARSTARTFVGPVAQEVLVLQRCLNDILVQNGDQTRVRRKDRPDLSHQ